MAGSMVPNPTASRPLTGHLWKMDRAEQHLMEEPAIAVIIQKMIFSEVSGVMFTADD